MTSISRLRDRIAAVPAAARRRAADSTTRSSVVADARVVAPEIPRDADAGHLVRAARRLMRHAAQDEFAREGVARVRLPEGSSRAELRAADVPGDASFHAFVEDVLSAVELSPSLLERDDAAALLAARSSSDLYGLSLEVASDLASYLLGRAFALEEAADDLEAYLAQQESTIREDMRAALVRQVRVPLELTVARERHRRIEEGELPEADDTVPTGGPGDRHATAEERASFARRAQSAFEFAQSEAGRAAFSVLRSGAERAYGRHGHREDEATRRTPPRTPPSS